MRAETGEKYREKETAREERYYWNGIRWGESCDRHVVAALSVGINAE